MTEFYLNIDEILEAASQIFPDPETADEEGLVASGGDLSVEMLVMAYCLGMFPWYSEGDPILWWSPDPRMIFRPEKRKVSKSLMRTIENNTFSISFDTAFDKVIQKCAGIKRQGQNGTWITKEMLLAYKELHRAGYAHSVEAWQENKLVGGLYGLSIGRAFFGESMFHTKTDASKVALVLLVQLLQHWDFELIDCQVTTAHLKRFGAREIPRKEFLKHLDPATLETDRLGTWSEIFETLAGFT